MAAQEEVEVNNYAMVDCTPPPASDNDVAAAFWDTLLLLLAAVLRDCLACLVTAAKKLTDCSATRRADVWRSEGCFLAYADGNTSSAHEDAFCDVISCGEEHADPNMRNTTDVATKSIMNNWQARGAALYGAPWEESYSHRE
uniref:Uncharacterized protein n=1 Tax=Aegilops tauschii TaxID=37682 RepID=M8D471_AEGTA